MEKPLIQDQVQKNDWMLSAYSKKRERRQHFLQATPIFRQPPKKRPIQNRIGLSLFKSRKEPVHQAVASRNPLRPTIKIQQCADADANSDGEQQ